MVVRGRGAGRKPGASPRDEAGIKVETAVAREGRVGKDARNRLCLDHGRQGFLRRGITHSINVGPGRNDAAKGRLSSRKAAPVVKIEGVEVCPEKAAQIPTGGKAGHISSRSMLSSRPSPKPTGRDRMFWSAAKRPDIGRNCAARVEDLGPTGARAEQTESALCVRKLADGGQESPGLTDAPADPEKHPEA